MVMYWAVASLLVIGLFIGIFGVIGVYVVGKDLNVGRTLGLGLGAIGSVMVLIGLRRPLWLFIPILRKDDLDIDYDPQRMSIALMVAGFSLLLGGLIYSYTDRIESIIYFPLLPALLSFVGRFTARRNDEG
ncbi:MAG: hypothetical protein SWE60_11600 [Thermodesulfobacteriota bacterium]|nr:hypothetical protein [Thermodesulfobacteriota bacterium]